MEAIKKDIQGSLQVEQKPAWEACECGCGNFVCNLHGGYAHDCECPPVEEWESDPYSFPLGNPRGRLFPSNSNPSFWK